MEESRVILRKLISSADVVVENFLPKVVQQLGLDYDSLAVLKNEELNMIRLPFNIPQVSFQTCQPAPRKGEHTEEILKSLGFTASEAAEFIRKKVV